MNSIIELTIFSRLLWSSEIKKIKCFRKVYDFLIYWLTSKTSTSIVDMHQRWLLFIALNRVDLLHYFFNKHNLQRHKNINAYTISYFTHEFIAHLLTFCLNYSFVDKNATKRVLNKKKCTTEIRPKTLLGAVLQSLI